MAIIEKGQGVNVGETEINDNDSESIKISSTDAKDYVTIDTSDGSEKLVFNSGQPGIAAQVGVSNRGPRISGTTGASYPAYNFIGDEDTGMTHLGTSNDDQLSLIAGGVEGIRLTEDTTILAEIKGKTIITDPSGPSGNIAEVGTAADTLVVDGAHDGGLTIVGETGDPMRLHFVADDYDNRSGILAKARGSGGASATRYLDFYAGGSSRMIVNQDDITIKEPTTVEHATLSTVGAIATALTGTFTATNGSTAISSGSSTAFTTELHVGSAIKIGSEVFTVTAIASDTALTLDSAFAGSTASGLSGTTDGGELFAVKTGDSKTLLGMNETGALQLNSSTGDITNGNLSIGDATALDTVTTGKLNTIVGNAPNVYGLTTGHSNSLYGYQSGEALTTGVRNTMVGMGTGYGTAVGVNDNTYLGVNAGAQVRGSGNVAIGSGCLTASGSSANNVSIGQNTMAAFTGQDCVGIGKEALNASSSSKATVVGYQALMFLTDATEHNTAIGYQAGNGLDDGEKCLFLGSKADTTDVDGDNQIAIGFEAVCDAPNKIMMGNHRNVDMTMDCPPITVKQTSTSGAGISLEHEGSTAVIAHIGEDGDGGWMQLNKAGTTEVKFICSGSSHVGSDTSRKFGVGNASPTSGFHSFGNNAYMTTAGNGLLTASHSVDVHSTLLYATSGGSDIVASLPTAVGILGRQYTFKLVTDGGNDLVITTNGSETMDGSGTTYTIDTAKHAVTIQSDNVGWQVISKYVP